MRTHYIRDAQGNIMATYRYRAASGSLKVQERPVYGSSRMGVDAYEVELAGNPPYDPMADPAGLVHYELADHLGNVTTVITDELLGVDVDSDSDHDYFQPFILSAQGYEPFGGALPGRIWDRRQGAPVLRLLRMLESGEDVVLDLNGTPVVLASYNSGYTTIGEYLADIVDELDNNSITANIVDEEIRIQDWPANSKLTSADDLASLKVSSYRHGFNGMEKDDEVHGATGTSYDFGARLYDPRIARWWTMDPVAKGMPGISPYAFSYNCPIIVNDPDGRSGKVTINYDNKTVVLSTTVYLYGPAATEAIAEQMQQRFDKGTNTHSVTDKSDPSVTWTVTVQVTYVYIESVARMAEAHGLTNKEVLSAKMAQGLVMEDYGLCDEDNLLCYDPGMKEETATTIIRGKAHIGGNLGWASAIGTAMHEPLHMVGFDERYSLGNKDPLQLTTDFLGNELQTELMSFHYADVLDFAQQLSKGVNGSYVYDNHTQLIPAQPAKTTIGAGGHVTISNAVSSGFNLIDNTNAGANPTVGVTEGTKRATPQKDR